MGPASGLPALSAPNISTIFTRAWEILKSQGTKMILRVCHQFGNKQIDCEAKILAQPSAAGNPRTNSHKWVKWPRGREETFWQGSPMHWIQNLCERLLKEQQLLCEDMRMPLLTVKICMPSGVLEQVLWEVVLSPSPECNTEINMFYSNTFPILVL